MIYAPIVIPTLSRHVHLKRCIESLALNPYAKHTDLLVSVDYPPSEKYYLGYEKVKEYLESGIEGFNSVKIYYQDHNLGAYGNWDFLYGKLKENGYETYIYTEDDNEFSPCFLEYIDKGLELFKQNEHVFMIGGYVHVQSDDCQPNNVGAVYTFTPWGYGTWIEKYEQVIQQVNKKRFLEILKDEELSGTLAINRGDMFRYLFEATVSDCKHSIPVYRRYYRKNGELAFIDQTIAPIMCLNGYYSIRPAVSLVRNWGVDDHSGYTIMSNSDIKYELQEISTDNSFDYHIEVPLKAKELSKYNKSDRIDYKPAKRAWLLRKVYLIFGRRPVSLIMSTSYYLSRWKSCVMSFIRKTNEESVRFAEHG